jgi:hypothetical protein
MNKAEIKSQAFELSNNPQTTGSYGFNHPMPENGVNIPITTGSHANLFRLGYWSLIQ